MAIYDPNSNQHSDGREQFTDPRKPKQKSIFLRMKLANLKNARLVARYFDVYRNYLWNNNLPDDSKSISVDALFDFVENHIDEDERNDLISQSKF
jgi:hypothetical protein